ncbi:MAG TPA: hypothetical protein VKL21_08960 [Candidatus Methanoperedens sp.]|nr:hypothetical protein [Candidatus Methanoperedens sp.]
MEDSTFGRRNKMNRKRKAGSASSKDPAISLDDRPVSLKQHFLYLSEDLLL